MQQSYDCCILDLAVSPLPWQTEAAFSRSAALRRVTVTAFSRSAVQRWLTVAAFSCSAVQLMPTVAAFSRSAAAMPAGRGRNIVKDSAQECLPPPRDFCLYPPWRSGVFLGGAGSPRPRAARPWWPGFFLQGPLRGGPSAFLQFGLCSVRPSFRLFRLLFQGLSCGWSFHRPA